MLDHVCPNLTKHNKSSTSTWPNTTRFGRHLVAFGQVLAEFWSLLVPVCRFRPTCVEVGQMPANFGPDVAKVAPVNQFVDRDLGCPFGRNRGAYKSNLGARSRNLSLSLSMCSSLVLLVGGQLQRQKHTGKSKTTNTSFASSPKAGGSNARPNPRSKIKL